MELFPQIIIGSSSTSRWEHLLSIGVGFLLAIALIYALNEVIKRFEDRSDLISSSPLIASSVLDNDKGRGYQVLHDTYKPIDWRNAGDCDQYLNTSSSSCSDRGPGDEENKHPCPASSSSSSSSTSRGESGSNNTPMLTLASQATSSPSHRGKIRRRLGDLHSLIEAIERRVRRMHAHGDRADCASRVSSSSNDSSSEKKLCADQIDEHIHRLEYALDHLRRLVVRISMFSAAGR